MNGIGRFLGWWRRELAACLPRAWRSDRARATPRLELAVGPGSIDLRHFAHTGVRELGHRAHTAGIDDSAAISEHLGALDARSTRIAVRLDEQACVSKIVELPIAALEDPRQVLEFELHRETPFSAEHAYYDFRLLEVDREHQRIRVELWAAPRALVDRALEVVADWGPVQDTGRRIAPVEPGVLWFSAPTYRARSATLVNSLLLVAIAGVVALLLAMPFTRQQAELAQLEPRVARMRALAAQAATTIERTDALSKRLATIEAIKTAAPAALLVLEEVARVLPDDTWLERLEMRSGKLTLHGTAATASALIALFEADTMFRDAHFVSPVTRGADGADRFRLTAEIAGAPR